MRQLTRRDALTRGTALFASSKAVFSTQANSKIALGIIGTGGHGRYVGKIFADDPRVKIAAVCDVYHDQIDRAKTMAYSPLGRISRDFRRFYRRAGLPWARCPQLVRASASIESDGRQWTQEANLRRQSRPSQAATQLAVKDIGM